MFEISFDPNFLDSVQAKTSFFFFSKVINGQDGLLYFLWWHFSHRFWTCQRKIIAYFICYHENQTLKVSFAIWNFCPICLDEFLVCRFVSSPLPLGRVLCTLCCGLPGDSECYWVTASRAHAVKLKNSIKSCTYISSPAPSRSGQALGGRRHSPLGARHLCHLGQTSRGKSRAREGPAPFKSSPAC